MALQDYFSIVEDPPYVERHYKHKLSDILIIALASYLCGGDVLSHARLGQDLYSGYTLSYYTACSGSLCKVILLFLKGSERSTPLPYRRGVKPRK